MLESAALCVFVINECREKSYTSQLAATHPQANRMHTSYVTDDAQIENANRTHMQRVSCMLLTLRYFHDELGDGICEYALHMFGLCNPPLAMLQTRANTS